MKTYPHRMFSFWQGNRYIPFIIQVRSQHEKEKNVILHFEPPCRNACSYFLASSPLFVQLRYGIAILISIIRGFIHFILDDYYLSRNNCLVLNFYSMRSCCKKQVWIFCFQGFNPFFVCSSFFLFFFSRPILLFFQFIRFMCRHTD